MQAKSSKDIPKFYPGYALGLLTLAYILNFLDRTIIYILFPLIKKELAFSDLELSLLGTTAFVIFYTLLGIPCGWIADNYSRKWLIAAGVVIWSVFSGLTAFAGGFLEIFICRVMVGVGEATLGPAAISLISDYFRLERRATATGVYSLGVAIGAGFAALAGGYFSVFGWRAAFMLIGFPGVLLGLIFLFIREPERTRDAAQQITVSEKPDWKKAFLKTEFILLCLGYALLGLATNNLSIWGPTFYNRVLGYEIPLIGYVGGVLTLAAGIPAMIFGGAIADKFRRKNRGGRMIFGAMVSFTAGAAWLSVIYSENSILIIISVSVLLAAGLSWLGAAAADATEIAGPENRGRAVAIYFFAVNAAAYLVGSNLIGWLSDRFGASAVPENMRIALLVCPLACFMAAAVLFLGAKRISKKNLLQV